MTGGDRGGRDSVLAMSVCICTRNRAASLAVTLAALERCHKPQGAWELLIIDNGSTDDTASVVEAFSERLPIRRLGERQPGVARARNTAMREARGAYMVCTDDDAVPAPDWIIAYERAFATFPGAVLFGGRIVPVLQPPVTWWFEEARELLDLPLARRDFGDDPMPLDVTRGHIPFGANYAVHTATQRAFRFDPCRGPGARYFGEETAAFEAMMQAGNAGMWVPDAQVSHIIPAPRQTERYIAWWFCMLGKTLAHDGIQPRGPSLFGVPRWLWRRRLETELAYRWARATAPPVVWVAKLIAASLCRGEFAHRRATSAAK